MASRFLLRTSTARALAVFALISGVASACSGAGIREALTTTTPSQSGGVPFIRATPVSWGPPTVELVFDGSTPVTMTGTLYTSNWVTSRGNWTKSPGVPVDWPAARAVHAPAEATLVLGTPTPPELVIMKAYRDVDPRTGEPTSDPSATYQCNRFSEPRCAFSIVADKTTVGGLPSEIVTAPYITVFCTWFVPPDQQGPGKSPNSYASAGWLFRTNLSSTRPVESH
jgi:hypothetical protein